jgi:hypothetical protein
MARDLTKIGITGNAPLEADGSIAARLADPNVVASTGAVWLRLNFVERRGKWLKRYDEIVDGILSKGLNVYGTIGHEALVHDAPIGDTFRTNRLPTHANAGQQRAWVEQYVDRFEEIVGRFHGRIGVFESFNEPNDFYGGSSALVGSPAWFAYMLGEIYAAVKPRFPDVTLVSGPLSGTWSNHNQAVAYLDEMYRYGLASLSWRQGAMPFDGVGYHIYVSEGQYKLDDPRERYNYSEEVEANYARFLGDIWRTIGRHEGAHRKQLWVSEFGWQSGPISEKFQANMIERGIDILANDDRVAMATLFCTEDFGKGSPWEATYGLYRQGDFGSGGRKKAWRRYHDIMDGVRGTQPPVRDLTEPRLTATASGVRVRAAPTLDAAVLAAAQPGDPLDILENREEAVTKVGREGKWIYVQTPGRVAGYVAAWYLQPYL